MAARLVAEGQVLNLSGTFFLTAKLVDLCPIPPTVKRITLENNRFATNDVVAALAKKCPQLTMLTLATCYQITDAACFDLAEMVPGLQSIDLSIGTSLVFVPTVSLEGAIVSLEGAIVSLEGAIVSLEGAIVSLDGAIVSLEGAIVSQTCSLEASVRAIQCMHFGRPLFYRVTLQIMSEH
jgi:hypothetical protein